VRRWTTGVNSLPVPHSWAKETFQVHFVVLYFSLIYFIIVNNFNVLIVILVTKKSKTKIKKKKTT